MTPHSPFPRQLVAAAVAALMIGAISATALASNSETKEIFRKTRTADWNHLPTDNPNEGNSSGYYIEGSLHFYAQPYGAVGGAPQGTVAVYRCLVNGWDHMLSTDYNCEGTKRERRIGYLLKSARSGHVAVYRCRSDSNNGEHFWSTDYYCEGKTREYRLGYALPSHNQHNQHNLNSGTVNNDCTGRCGLGCSWMPWEAWTPECRRHDECVRDNGHLKCLDGRMLDAAVSYVAAGAKQLVRSIGNAIKSFFRWF
jgi:hypothetical protein